MKQASGTALMSDGTNGATRDAFDRLTFLGWRRGLMAIVVGLAVSFLLFGCFVVYWRNADMDFMVIYNALVLNDGKPQAFFDHPAYITILSVKLWLQMLHALGVLGAWSLSTMPPASDVPAFDAAMTGAIRAGRVLVWLIATTCVLVFAALARRILRDWRIALIATTAFALSGGVAVHSRIMRSELVAACPVIFALMILIMVGRRASPIRPLWMALAAALCVLGLENKVQAILLIGALPLLILPSGGAQGASAGFWRNTRWRWLAAGTVTTAAAAAVWLALPLISVGLDRALLDAAHFRPLFLDRFGIYQPALLVLIVGCMIAYAIIWRVSPAETVASMSAVAAGASAALLALQLKYDANDVIAVINPLEKMLTFVDASVANVASGPGLGGIAWLVLEGVASVAARYTFVLHSSPRPTVFLTWLIIPGIVLAWRRGERQTALEALLLLLAAIGIDALGVRRGLKVEYFIFTDPLLILAGAVLLDRMGDLGFRKWSFTVAMVLFGLHIAVAQAEPVKYAFQRRGPEPVCQWNRDYMPLLPLPWCKPSS